MPIGTKDISNTDAALMDKAIGLKLAVDIAPGVHHVIRTFSTTGLPNAGSLPASQIDEYLTSFLEDGWRLFASHYLGAVPEGYTMLWIFVR